MLLLVGTSDLIQVITASSTAVKCHASFVKNIAGAMTPARKNTASITSNTTTDISGTPAGATDVWNMKFISVRNDHASLSNLVTIQHTDGTNVEPLWVGTLLAGESVNFNEGVGWQYLDANGNPKLAATKLDVWLRIAGSNYVNATTSFTDITGLSVPVKSGKHYMFEAHLIHKNDASSTGSQFAVNGPAMTLVQAGTIDTVTPSVTASAHSAGVATALDTAATAQTTGSTSNRLAILSGYFNPSADGTFTLRGKSEVAVAAGLTVLIGSWVHIRELDN